MANPRYENWKARERALAIVRQRAAQGEPCAICGLPIELDRPQTYIDPRDGKRKRAPWSLECDEIVPISRGGSPINPSNIQPTHRVCNQRKGSKPNTKVVVLAPKTSRRW